MKLLFSLLFINLIFFSNAQSPQEITQQYIDKYPFTKIVTLKDYMNIDISIDKNDELIITKTIIESNLILDKKASLYNSGGIQYSELIDLNYIKASTLSPEEKKYKEVKVEEDVFSTKDKLGGSVFYDDTKEVKFIYPKLKQGAIKNLEYQLDIKEPRFLGRFYFQSNKPAEDVMLEIVTDKKVDIGFTLFHTDTFNIKYTKEEKKGRIIHQWTTKNINEYKYEASSLSGAYFVPHIILFIKQYETESGVKKILSSIDDLHDWYYELVKDINTQENTSLKNIVDSLVLETDTDLEKVKKVYSWVQDNIKYIAFEDAYGGFIPREAVDICEKRYGDCKDMASIITEMLEIANVKADLTWVGTREIPYTYNEVFTPSVDNHMIASFTDADGEVYFLDATSSYLPFGIVSEFIQGKQAMVNVGKGEYKLVEVPITAKEENFVYDSVNISLKDNIIKGNGYFSVTGYPKVKFSYSFPSLTDKEKKDFVKGFEKGNNKFVVSKTKDLNFKDKTKPSIITYDFEIDSYLSKAENEVYINLHLDKYLKSSTLDDERKLPYDMKHKFINKQIVSFTIPDGFSIDYIPENNRFENESFSYSIEYTKDNDVLKLVSQIEMKTILIEPNEFEDWNKMIKQLNKNYSEVVVLKKI